MSPTSMRMPFANTSAMSPRPCASTYSANTFAIASATIASIVCDSVIWCEPMRSSSSLPTALALRCARSLMRGTAGFSPSAIARRRAFATMVR